MLLRKGLDSFLRYDLFILQIKFVLTRLLQGISSLFDSLLVEWILLGHDSRDIQSLHSFELNDVQNHAGSDSKRNISAPKPEFGVNSEGIFSMYLRGGLVHLLEQALNDMTTKASETKLGPARYRRNRYFRYIKLLRHLLMIFGGLEKRLAVISRNTSFEATLSAFLRCKSFRQSILQFSVEFSSALSALCRWQGDNSDSPPASALNAMKSLRECLEDMESSYSEARHEIYYCGDVKHRHQINAELSLQLNGLLFLIKTAGTLVVECEPRLGANGGAPSGKETVSLRDKSSSFITKTKKLWFDLVPAQSQLFRCSWVSMSPEITLRLRQAGSVSVSMLLAGVYGQLSDALDPTFAAFTVTFLVGGEITGANVVTSFNRIVGTVFACVLSLLVAKAVTGWSVVSAKWFIGVVIVLVQLPATYTRSLPKYGYAGLVLGFTVPVLLLSYPDFSPDVAVERIVDTIVAGIIFIAVDFSLLALHSSSEELLLDSTLKVFSGIEKHFLDFVEVFKASCVGRLIKTNGNHHSIYMDHAAEPSPTFLLDIHRQKELSRFISIELNLWRPAHFRRGLIKELLQLEEVAHNSIAYISWAVDASHKFDHSKSVSRKVGRYQESTKFSNFLEPLESHLSDVVTVMCKASAQLRYGVQNLRKSYNQTRDRKNSFFSLFTSSNPLGDASEVEALAKRDVHEENSLFQKFLSVIESLQGVFDESRETLRLDEFTEDAEAEPRNLDRIITSSAEVMIVNTVLVSLRDLLEAMSGLAKAVMRLQAHRTVHQWETSYFDFTRDFLHWGEVLRDEKKLYARRVIEYDNLSSSHIDFHESLNSSLSMDPISAYSDESASIGHISSLAVEEKKDSSSDSATIEMKYRDPKYVAHKRMI